MLKVFIYHDAYTFVNVTIATAVQEEMLQHEKQMVTVKKYFYKYLETLHNLKFVYPLKNNSLVAKGSKLTKHLATGKQLGSGCPNT